MNSRERMELVLRALGKAECTCCIENVQIINVFTKEVLPGRVFIYNEYIADVDYYGTSKCFAKEYIDGKGKFLSPGLIDSHVHIESSMLTPRNFAKAVIPTGTTTIITDPHELANVLGVLGIEYVLADSEDIPMDYFVLIPSCVPALLGKENSGSIFTPHIIEELLLRDRVLGLGEVMDYIGVMNNSKRMVDIIEVAMKHKKFIQGHAPCVHSNELSAYLCGGPVSCHESQTREEGLERLRKGMWVDAREGSLVQNLRELIRGLPDKTHPPINLTFCSDDKEGYEIVTKGHINNSLRIAVEEGMPAVEAVACATLHSAREIGLQQYGAIAPGYIANCVLFDSLTDFKALAVWYKGDCVAKEGVLLAELKTTKVAMTIEKHNSINIPSLQEKDFLLTTKKQNSVSVTVMSFEDESSLIAHKKMIDLPVIDTVVQLEHDTAKLNYIAVINRYGKGTVTVGIVENFHISQGAVASSVGHDCHNVTVVYTNPRDAFIAVERIKALHGGCVCVQNGEIIDEVPLPIGGLLSPLPPVELHNLIERYNMTLAQQFGITHSSPIMRTFFMTLAVIPYVKITDIGLIDVITQEFIAVVEE